jgi:glycosyltransferase involved in cell wall biosynthesis
MNANRITIGINGSMLDEHPTGVGVYSYNLINHLCELYRNGHTGALTVFSPSDSFLSNKVRVIKLSQYMRASQYGKIAALTRFLWNTFLYPFQARKYDVRISPTTHGSFFLRNQIITIHDLLSLRYNNISRHQRFYFKYLLPFLVSRSRLVITVSESTRQDVIHYLKCNPEKVKVVYNGYDDTKYFRQPAQDHIFKKYGIRNYFLAVGPTYPHKNFETLLNAYSSLPPDIKKTYPLLIAGGMKNYLDHLKNFTDSNGLSPYVYFTGYVEADLMPSLYREAFALIFPSLYEGFGFPLLEAMACGCPVLCSSTSSMPEVCGEAALYFDPLKVSSLSEAMQSLIADAYVRASLMEKGLVQAKKFSWQKTAMEFKSIIDHQFHTK